MFEMHPSQFLFIGARRNRLKYSEKDDDCIQFVYIGDSKDYSTYKLFTCANHGALDEINPKELDPENLHKIKVMQNLTFKNIKAEFTGSLPAIKFNGTFEFLTLEQFNNSSRSNSNSPQHASESSSSKGNKNTTKHDKTSKKSQSKHEIRSTHGSQPKASHSKMEWQNIPMVTLPKPNGNAPVAGQSTLQNSPDPVPSTSKQCQNGMTINATNTVATTPIATPRAAAAATSSSQSIHYVCITQQIYDDLSNQMPSYQTRMCCMCFDFRKIENQTDFQKYLLHLMRDHACKHKEQMTDAKALFDHRMQHHRNDPIMALQIGKSIDEDPQNQWLVHKIVRARYQCKLCGDRFDLHRDIKAHNSQKHRDIFHSIEIVYETMIIKSNDPQQLVNHKAEFTPLVLYKLFKCDRCKSCQTIGRKLSAIQHHNEFHLREPFEVSIHKLVYNSENPPKKYHDMDTAAYREYLYQCTYCTKYFDSYKSFELHSCDDHDRIPQFQMHKLVKCDKIIGTFNHMKCRNARKYPGKQFTPVNVFCRNECGICGHQFKDDADSSTHYSWNHRTVTCNFITNELLDSMNVKNVDIGECFYTPGCCPVLRRKKLDQIVLHASSCTRRFRCYQCPMQKFENSFDFLTHCKELHGKTTHQCFDELHNLKTFQELLSDMHISFPNGLYVNIENISDTEFENKLSRGIREKIIEIIEKEKKYHRI